MITPATCKIVLGSLGEVTVDVTLGATYKFVRSGYSVDDMIVAYSAIDKSSIDGILKAIGYSIQWIAVNQIDTEFTYDEIEKELSPTDAIVVFNAFWESSSLFGDQKKTSTEKPKKKVGQSVKRRKST